MRPRKEVPWISSFRYAYRSNVLPYVLLLSSSHIVHSRVTSQYHDNVVIWADWLRSKWAGGKHSSRERERESGNSRVLWVPSKRLLSVAPVYFIPLLPISIIDLLPYPPLPLFFQPSKCICREYSLTNWYLFNWSKGRVFWEFKISSSFSQPSHGTQIYLYPVNFHFPSHVPLF